MIVQTETAFLGMNTSYEYTVAVAAGQSRVTVRAESIYGALYGLETLYQLMDVDRATLVHSEIMVDDGPQSVSLFGEIILPSFPHTQSH